MFIEWKNGSLHNSYWFFFIQPFIGPLFSSQQELSNLDYYFQDGWKRVHKQIKSFWKLKKHILTV